MAETETISFREMVEGTDAERFNSDGYTIEDLEWVDGGLKITASEWEPKGGK